MAEEFWAPDSSHKIVKRVVVEAGLVLESPAHFGNGDSNDIVDMPLLRDPYDGRSALLTGTSLCGALRSSLRNRCSDDSINLLFGAVREDENGDQSRLIVDDSVSQFAKMERRESVVIDPKTRTRAKTAVPNNDGTRESVVIDPKTRTAEEGKLFNLDVWRAGTVFPLRLELLILEGDDENNLKTALCGALIGLNDGSITLGARKRRGFGQVFVSGWRIREYDMATIRGLLDWMDHGAEPLEGPKNPDLSVVLGEPLPDLRRRFSVGAVFSLDGSFLIRSGAGRSDVGPDMVHLHRTHSDGKKEPVLSGTSLAGTLRARAGKILRTLGIAEPNCLVQELFGNTKKAGKVTVREAVIQGVRDDLIQHRVAIDRFTGGAVESALFDQQPVFGRDGSSLSVTFSLLDPYERGIGLLLLLLKDLWTGDLPLGGESSVGRGRLKGQSAVLTLHEGDRKRVWNLEAKDQTILVSGGEIADLEAFVAQLRTQ